MDWLSIPGDPLLWTGISIILLFSYHYIPEKNRKLAIKFIFLVMPSAGLGYGLSLLLKDFFAIPRPCFGLDMCPSGFSMPSSHSTVAFSAMGALGFFTTHWLLILAAIVAISRVVEGVHTWPDVIVGALLGLLIANSVYQVYKIEFEREKNGNKKSKRRNKNSRHR